MFQTVIDQLFHGISNVFNIGGDILIAGFDEVGRDYHVTIDKVLRKCCLASLKLISHECLLRCTSIHFLGETILQYGVSPYPLKIQALKLCQHLSKEELQSFLGILNYLSNLSSVTAEVCKTLWKPASVKAEWAYNRVYQELYDKMKITLLGHSNLL